MDQKMEEKKANDKSFERKKQQKRRKGSAPSNSQPAMSYREVRARSESEQKKKKQTYGNPKTKKSSRDPDEKRPAQQTPKKKRVNTSLSTKSEDDKKQRTQLPQRKNSQSGQQPQGRNNNYNNSQNEHTISGERKKHNQESKGNAPVHKDASPNDVKPSENASKPQTEQSTDSEINKNPQKVKTKKSAKPFSARKRRRKIFAIYSSMVMVILVIAAFLCLTVFFKIDSISVEGKTRYSSNEIVDASGISIGTNMILCDTDSGIDDIKKKFPYIENVAIKKNPFNSVTIFVEEAKPTTAIETNGKFYILSAGGKIIEILDTNKYNVPLIKGAELKKTELSATIEYKLDGMNEIINSITEALKSNEINNVSTIDVTNPSNIKLSYDKRLTVIIGMPDNIDYKIKTAKILINDKLEKDSKGTVDVSMCAEGGKYSYYDPSGAPES